MHRWKWERECVRLCGFRVGFTAYELASGLKLYISVSHYHLICSWLTHTTILCFKPKIVSALYFSTAFFLKYLSTCRIAQVQCKTLFETGLTKPVQEAVWILLFQFKPSERSLAEVSSTQCWLTNTRWTMRYWERHHGSFQAWTKSQNFSSFQ